MRLKSEIWVKSYLRRCVSQGCMGVVVRHGDDDAGAIYIKVRRADGACVLFGPAPAGLSDAQKQGFVLRQTTTTAEMAQEGAFGVMDSAFGGLETLFPVIMEALVESFGPLEAIIGGAIGKGIKNFKKASKEPDEIDVTPEDKKIGQK